MTDDTALARAKTDILHTDWRHRTVTILLATGLTTFGFMLGVHYMAAHTFTTLPPLALHPEYKPLQSTYDTAMNTGMAVAGTSLVLGVALELRRRTE